MPLIRYKTRDLAIRNTNRLCKCKREHDIVIKIDGRIEDIIVTPDGRHIGRLDAAFKFNKGFDFAQIIQNDLNSIDVYIVKNNQFDEHEEKILDENLKDRVGHTIKINYHYKDKIEAGSNGKTRLVINHYLQNN